LTAEEEPNNSNLSPNPKELVKAGYAKVSWAYRSDQPDAATYAQYRAWVNELKVLLPVGAAVLELGCGSGVPATQLLAESFKVIGVDISPVQIARASQAVPQAQFVESDMTTLDFAAASFEGIVSFYALIHVPLEEQPALFERLARWLKPGGYLLATVGSKAWTGTEEDWLDVLVGTMYWSHADTETYEQWLVSSGLVVVWSRFVAEGNDGGGHSLILAYKPSLAEGQYCDSCVKISLFPNTPFVS
jgi:ubiquinone/menaquinone biosynthesis C-methylase UbiE